ncbi:MAG TPA: HPP family protein [Tepidisphaeraceae bacterium]|nr:HPP family protein [Tepidisphaeraceae bacterium]
MNRRTRLMSLVGLELTPNNHREKLISGLGAFLAIAAVALLTQWQLGPLAVMPVVASMGASAVLLFAAPHGPLSQPWPLVMGHLVSATIGVTCARFVPNAPVAAALAVGLSVTAMYYGRCIHPPGGATALTAVLGGEALRSIGYTYLLTPVAVNVAVMLLIAVAFNALFPWRQYPAALHPAHRKAGSPSREDWAHALGQVESLANVSEEELIELHALAQRHAESKRQSRPVRREKRKKTLV